MLKERSIVVSIILTIVTCGIYGIYWFIVMTDDAVKANDGKEYQTSGGVAFLLSIVTCGIYSLYWYYKMGKAISVAKADRNMPAGDNSVLYLVLGIFGFGIISYCLIQSDLNNIAKSE